jgi:hypothetical protein
VEITASGTFTANGGIYALGITMINVNFMKDVSLLTPT